MKVTFVYANPRRALLEQIAAGEAPESPLLGQSHMREFGIEADIHDPLLSRRQWKSPRANWLAWYLRELVLPWELRNTDAVCTTLYTAFPVLDRLRSRPTYIFNMGLCKTLARASNARRRLLTASLRASGAVLNFATAQRDLLLEQTGLAAKQGRVLPMGVDDAFFSPRRAENGEHVLAVGFDLGRDYPTFMKAVSELPYKVVVVARLRRLQGISIPPNVDLQPDASFVELRDLYAGARCVVIPTRAEEYPFGGDTTGATVLVESMAMAKPIVVTDRPWLRDYVVDGESARLVPAEDPDRLREAIRETCEDRSLSDALGEAALGTVKKGLTARHMAGRLAEIIRSNVPAGSSSIPEPIR